MKKFSILALTCAFFVSCANTTFHSNNTIKESPEEQFRVFGAYTSNITGPIYWGTSGLCNATRFINNERTRLKIHNIIDIKMEQKCFGREIDENCNCNYSGLGIVYSKLNKEDAKDWNIALNYPVIEEQKTNLNQENHQNIQPTTQIKPNKSVEIEYEDSENNDSYPVHR